MREPIRTPIRKPIRNETQSENKLERQLETQLETQSESQLESQSESHSVVVDSTLIRVHAWRTALAHSVRPVLRHLLSQSIIVHQARPHSKHQPRKQQW